MYCKNCGAKNEPDAAFCEECGAPLEKQTPPEQMHTEPISLNPVPSPEKSGKASPKKTPVLPIVLVLIIAVLVCVVIFLLSNGKDDGETVNSQNSQTGEMDEAETETAEPDMSEPETEDLYSAEASGEISMKVLERSPDLTEYVKVRVNSAEASSEIYQEKYDNSAWSAFDGNEVTSWQENAAGSGVGEWLYGEFAGEYKVKYIGLKVGNWRDSSRFWGNNRPTELEISIGGYSETIYLSDEMKEQWIELSEACDASDITITVRNVVRGDNWEWNEACISEVEIYAE